MATPQQIAEQVALERDQIRQGLKRLRKNTKDLEDKSYASATVYGIASIDTLLPHVVERIQATTHNRLKRGTGYQFQLIKEYVSKLEPLAAAAIACKITFDKVFGYKDKTNQMVKVCDSIGHAVEDECQMRHYEEKAPGLLNVLKENYWHKACGTQQKITVIQTLMNRYDVTPWVAWGRAERVKLGAWLLDCIMVTSGWFEKDLRLEGTKKVNYVVPTPEFLEIKDQVMKNSELFAPLAWPMLIEPNDWSEKPGGYLLNEVMRGHEMVRRGHPTTIQGKIPIEFLNRIQKVGYKLNPCIVSTAEWLFEKGISVGKFIPIIEIPLPPKPPDIATNDQARKTYRRQAAEVRNENANAFRRSCRTRMTMEAVERFKDETFFIPWSFDYRGRAYPIPAFLTPQDTDYGKALIRFSNDSPVTNRSEYWLAFQVATTYGLDKETMNKRQEWVKDNITLISSVACDPIRHRPKWEEAEEPWQFLAACDEYYHCVLIKDRSSTSLPIAVDATCSGLQILAGLARDRKTAELVNVLDSPIPQDAYRAVADEARPNCPKKWREHVDRKVAKRLVMTIPYNAKFQSNWRYVNDALNRKGEFDITNFHTAQGKGLEVPKESVTAITHALRDATHNIFPGPMAVMKWIEEEVSNALARGWKELSWTTPSGFIVQQKIMKRNVQLLELKLLGRCKVSVAADFNDQVDKCRHKAATAPNLIHSLDSSLLHITATKFKHPVALIHDSVLCRASDMDELSELVRETYMKLFADNNYLKDFAEQIGAESEPPIIGDLEPSNVLKSTYFFC